MCIHAIITKDVYICYEDDLDEDDLNLALIILFQCVDICTAEPCVIDRQMKSELLQYLNYMQCTTCSAPSVIQTSIIRTLG